MKRVSALIIFKLIYIIAEISSANPAHSIFNVLLSSGRQCTQSPVTLNFTPSVSTSNEGDGTININATLSGTACKDITVHYGISGNSTLGSDYSGITGGSFIISKGTSSKQFSYSIDQNGDQNVEKLLTVYAKGSESTSDNLTVGSNAQVIQTILDDETVGYRSITAVGGSNDTHCSVDANNRLMCWGRNDYGQVGSGDTKFYSTPYWVENISFKKVSAGRQLNCALTVAGKVYCWGQNGSTYNLGLGHTTAGIYFPTPVDSGTTYLDISAGHTSGCGITDGNKLKCWGANGNGQLGDGTTTAIQTPTVIDAANSYLMVSSSKAGYFTCAITTANKLKCWGDNAYGKLGIGGSTDYYTPQDVDSATDYKYVALGANHACAITTGNKLKCWGQNTYAKATADGSSAVDPATPVAVDAGNDYKAVSLGTQHTCGIVSDNSVKCWGYNANRELADGSSTNRLVPVVSDGGATYKVIEASENWTCGITSSDVLKCWGANSNGRLANGTVSTGNTVPTVVDSGVSYQSTGGSVYHGCAVTLTGRLKCSGYNQYGEVGDGTTTQRISFVEVDMGLYQSVGSGMTHTCALTNAGRVKCWGDNTYGQLGTNNLITYTTPQIIFSTLTFTKLSVGEYHNCAIATTGALYCWGRATNGQLGNGTTNQDAPTIVSSGTSFIDVGTGEYHTCAVTSANVLRCFGLNDFSQLGDNTVTQRTAPVTVDSGVTYAKVSAGYSSTCGITTSDVLKCWGYRANGRVGDGSTAGNAATPVIVDSGVSYSAISVNYGYACGIVKTSNILKCWGYNNNGMLGDGSLTSRSLPTVIDSGVQYTAVAAGRTSTCGITNGGILKCWGDNTQGQLGDGLGGPIKIRSIADVNSYLSFDTGAKSSCMVNSAGIMSCWGSNSYNQIGDTTSASRQYPRFIDLGTRYSSVDAGIDHNCGVTTAGVLKCWGRNDYRQVGDGTTTNRSAPTAVDTGNTYSQVSAGGLVTCGRTTSNKVRCWGYNTDGRAGDGTGVHVNNPTDIDAGTDYSFIDAGAGSVCGIVTPGGALKCWGLNSYGQIGNGSGTNVLSPTVIDSGTSYQTVSVGGYSACGITTAGVLKCWGKGGVGELGQGNTSNSSVPLVVDSGTTYSKVSFSKHTVCAITTGGVLKCWGDNSVGQIPESSSTSVTLPTVVDAGVTYTDVSVGGSNGSGSDVAYVCGQTSVGMKCWGGNSHYAAVGMAPVLYPKYVPRVRQP